MVASHPNMLNFSGEVHEGLSRPLIRFLKMVIRYSRQIEDRLVVFTYLDCAIKESLEL